MAPLLGLQSHADSVLHLAKISQTTESTQWGCGRAACVIVIDSTCRRLCLSSLGHSHTNTTLRTLLLLLHARLSAQGREDLQELKNPHALRPSLPSLSRGHFPETNRTLAQVTKPLREIVDLLWSSRMVSYHTASKRDYEEDSVKSVKRCSDVRKCKRAKFRASHILRMQQCKTIHGTFSIASGI